MSSEEQKINFEKKLLTFENQKTICPLSIFSKYFSKERNNEQIKKFLSRIFPFIDIQKKISIYCFVYKGTDLITLYKTELNTPLYKQIMRIIFMLPPIQATKLLWKTINEQDKFEFLKDFIQDITQNKQQKVADYTIDFYIFSERHKHQERNFSKLYQLLQDDFSAYKLEYEKNYFGNIIETTSSFFIDSSNFFKKHLLLISTSLLIYTMYFYQYELEILGIPSNLISTLQLVSIIKLYSSIITSVIIFIVCFSVFYMYLLSISSTKQFLYKAMNVIIAFTIYVFTITLILNHNYFKLEKSNIKNDDFFLLQYFTDNTYPKVMIKASSSILVVGSDDKLIYFYPLDKLCFNFDKTKKLEYTQYGQFIIDLFKYSKYSEIHNLEFLPIDKAYEEYKIKNTLESITMIKNLCNSDDSNISLPSHTN